jgi:hypothetical protein
MTFDIIRSLFTSKSHLQGEKRQATKTTTVIFQPSDDEAYHKTSHLLGAVTTYL